MHGMDLMLHAYLYGGFLGSSVSFPSVIKSFAEWYQIRKLQKFRIALIALSDQHILSSITFSVGF